MILLMLGETIIEPLYLPEFLIVLQSVIVVLLLVVVLVTIAEIIARFGLGLGSPPLWQEDSEIEYLAQPSKSYLRFGKRISYNSYSMRSDEFPVAKPDPNELRVLVIGDSIVNGGANVDQDALATSILLRKLHEVLNRPVVVGNISAASWGPPNYLAYIKRYGTFQADVAVIVVNSEDYADAPTFEPLTRRRPQRKPVLALQELFDKYLPRYVLKKIRSTGPKPSPTADQIQMCLDALKEIVGLLRKDGVHVLIAQHLNKCELAGEPEIGHGELGRTIRELDIEPIQLGSFFAKAIEDGINPYHDQIHPSDIGQKIISEVLLESIIDSV